MIRLEEALLIIEQQVEPSLIEAVSLESLYGRVLAQDVFADTDIPPFDKSAVDGYACRRSDVGLPALKVIETIAAGKLPEHKIGEGECSKIMTGSIMPQGADTVVMIEDTQLVADNFICITAATKASNYCLRGEDIRKNEKVLSVGTHLRPQEIAILASVGCCKPMVYRNPHFGIVSTGDELVHPEILPSPGHIRNSNAFQLMAQIQRAGCTAHFFGIASDSEQSIRQSIENAALESDIILVSGGISAGEFDLVPHVLAEAGFEILFRDIAIQPGKPVIFARRNDKFLVALPGNPVASYVLFEVMVKPLINRFSGRQNASLRLRLPLAVDYSRKKNKRKAFFPVCITQQGTIIPVEYHGSAHMHAYTNAHAIAVIEAGEFMLPAGALAEVILI